MKLAQDDARLAVSRQAAKLFLERGVGGTSGDDIAEASGLSKRTVWRYFRTKESCVAPLFALSWKRFVSELQRWPREVSLEAHLVDGFDLGKQSEEQIADAILIVRLIAALPDEPDLRSIWLLSYHDGEEQLMTVIADRLDRSHNDFDVRLCAAAVMSAVRTIDETISLAAVRYGQTFTSEEVLAQLSRAIRSVSNLPFCDPVVPKPFGDDMSAAGDRHPS
ncbi:TetR/AcrR family transcriptional regulator [Rhizobium puerariae]|uniref:TetR/AcrR family transcriptional regulator n=1 Tax=Rhizobium puerariae TaxID=1585791 RepID=A0ABV6ACL9_9HYPH